MVASSPATTTAESPAVVGRSESVENPDAGLAASASPTGGGMPETTQAPGRTRGADTSFPGFVALIQTGPRRRTPRAVDSQAVTAGPSAARPETKPTRRNLASAALHPAWLEAIPASIDDLQGASAPAESDLDAAVREPVVLGARHVSPRFALPRGQWPWWAWVTYASTIGTATCVGMFGAAVARLALPKDQRLWVYRTRLEAVQFIAIASTVLATATGAYAIVPPRARVGAPVVQTTAMAPRPNAPVMEAAVAVPIPTAVMTGVLSTGATDPLTGSAQARFDAAGIADVVTPLAITQTHAESISILIAPEPIAPEGTDLTLPAEAQATLAPPVATAEPRVSPSPRTPATAASRVVVANTGGRGVAFRNSTKWDDRVVPKVAFREGTALTAIETGLDGDDGAGGLTPWLRVRDSVGRTGYIPSRFVQAP